jgi:hypothetical protein
MKKRTVASCVSSSRLQFDRGRREPKGPVETVPQRAPRMPLLMLRVRSGHSAQAGSMKSDRAVAFLASPNHVAQPESLFDRNHDPTQSTFTGCLVYVPLSDLAFVDMSTGHAPSRSSCGFRAHRGGAVSC